MRILLSALLFVFFIGKINAQELAIGQWRAHYPYRVGDFVTQSSEQIFYAMEWGLAAIDKADMAVDFIDKTDGLSNAGISRIQYHEGTQTLVIVYENSVIDLRANNGQVTTMNQIPNFSNFSGDKSVKDIFVDSDSTILIGATFGLSRINLRRAEFDFTTFTGVDVDNIANFQGQILAATAEGVYAVDSNNPVPENFGNWTLLGPAEGFPANYSSNVLERFNEQLYVGIDDALYRWDGQQTQLITQQNGFRLHYLSGEGTQLIAGYRCNSGCSRGKALYVAADDSFRELPNGCFGVPNNAIEDEQGRIWFGDGWRNIRYLNNADDSGCREMSFNSPYSPNNSEMTVYDNQLWLASGGVDQRFSYLFLDHGFSSFIDGQWDIYNRNNTTALKGVDPDDGDDDLLDFLTVAVNPATGVVYAGSFFEGLIEFDGENMTLYNDENSSLNNATGDRARTRISGLAFDEDNNLWVANHLAARPVSVLKSDGSWQSFRPACGVTEIHQVAIDLAGVKWFATSNSSAGVVAFDPGDLDDPTDDRCRVFTQNNSELPTNSVNCVVADQDGDVWIGTTEGITIFECGSGVFDNNCRGSRRIVEVEGIAAFLLAAEEVQTIAIDGANRKWVGTKNGVFVLSPDGEEQLLRFTAANSPLPDDNIIDIAINPDNGEAFIGTDKGVVSYRSAATEGSTVHQSEVQVFPNPVRPTYRGPIAIQGLARDAIVKITDINGRLVYETTALGGQAIWEGTDYNGRRAQSGVYLVFSSTNPRESGFREPDAAVARIVFIN